MLLKNLQIGSRLLARFAKAFELVPRQKLLAFPSIPTLNTRHKCRHRFICRPRL